MSAPEQEVPPAPEPMTLEDLIRGPNSRISQLLSSVLGLSSSDPSPDRHDSGESRPVRERIVLINPLAQSVVLIEGSGNLEAFFRDVLRKEGQSPATKASIEAMPAVEIAEEGLECSICLEEYEVGGEAKEMPCKHRYHSGCIEKWLGIHGSCPICRYKMPVEGEESKKGEEEGGGRRIVDEIWVSFYVPDGDQRDSNSGPTGGPDERGSGPAEERDDDDDEEEDDDDDDGDDESSTTQDMDIDIDNN